MSEKEKREYHSRSNGIFFRIEKTLFKKRSRYQEIEVIENPYFGHMLFLDGLVQTTEKDEFFYHEMLIHPALIAHPDPRQILIIGGGDGGALRQTLLHPVEKVRMVEIDPDVIAVAQKYFPWLLPSLDDERASIVTADGRKFLEGSPEKYDVVFIDSSEPVGPSVTLHERSFYQLIKDRLAPDGIACAQMGAPFFQVESLKRAKDDLEGVFGIVRLLLVTVIVWPDLNRVTFDGKTVEVHSLPIFLPVEPL